MGGQKFDVLKMILRSVLIWLKVISLDICGSRVFLKGLIRNEARVSFSVGGKVC